MEDDPIGRGRAFVDSHNKQISVYFLIVIMFFEFTLAHPLPVWAAQGAQMASLQLFSMDDDGNVIEIDVIEDDPIEESPALVLSIKKITESKKIVVVPEKKYRRVSVVATAYSSSVEETDSDPCTTANGFNVCKNNIENVIATNFLPFGTRVRIPDLYGERTFTVHDRMNSRYGSGRIDIWMKTKNSARQFGVKRLKMEIVEEQVAANL